MRDPLSLDQSEMLLRVAKDTFGNARKSLNMVSRRNFKKVAEKAKSGVEFIRSHIDNLTENVTLRDVMVSVADCKERVR